MARYMRKFQTLLKDTKDKLSKDVNSLYVNLRTWYNLIKNTNQFSCLTICLYFETGQANSKVYIEK